ncbi:MAG TPA: TolC family protein [Pirellulaceae bacterium]|jgi:outer membrane protein TolC
MALSLVVAAALTGCATSRKAQQAIPVAAPPTVVAATTTEPTNRVQPASYHDEVSDVRSTEAFPAPEQIDARGAKSLEDDRPSLPLDMATALGLTQAQNPRVAFAQAQIAQSLAVHDAARAMWLPSIRTGGNYNKHEGKIQQVEGDNITASRGAAFGGLGAFAVGAGSPAIPGVYAMFHTTDAIFQRRITGYALEAREFQATATMNDQLLETALAYLALLEAAQRKAIAAETLEHGAGLARLTSEFARTGAGNEADADRATAALALLKNEVARAEESEAVASARVSQQLSSDPTILIVPQEDNIVPIDLVPLDTMTMGDLVAAGLSNRPELAASRSLVGEAVNRLKREENAPWLPSILLGMSYGGFGAGTGGQITNGGNRFDFDGVAWWELRNLGVGEKAARDNARAQIQQARMQEVQTMDLVAREVVETYSQVQARQKQIAAAKEGIAAAHRSYDRNLERIRNVQGLPIEVLQSIQALDAARREYLRAVVDYNTAQFRLHRALGWPIGV